MASSSKQSNPLYSDSSMDNEIDDSYGLHVYPESKLNDLRMGFIVCPISTCKQILTSTSLLSHYISSHLPFDKNNRLDDVYGRQPVKITFNPFNFKMYETVCIGVLMYGGLTASNRKSLPCKRNISLPNSMLNGDAKRYKNHLPIFVLVTKCKIDDYNGVTDQQMMAVDSKSDFVLVIWLASTKTTVRLHGCLKLSDYLCEQYRGGTVRVHSISKTKKPWRFMTKLTECLRVNRGLLNRYVNPYEKLDNLMVQLDCYIMEYNNIIHY